MLRIIIFFFILYYIIRITTYESSKDTPAGEFLGKSIGKVLYAIEKHPIFFAGIIIGMGIGATLGIIAYNN
ncbi:hypothetical protein CHL78_016610 [Romboutsia weinsteinii]|uniref:Uncharacterized protein n=1 Tax=Romboutsia weinsteinii TaxID=2020949 RepID=A0A371IZ47_9FIRM|nr:hypothetical protein [Romboutsia weinsteinii]RDY25757.1 hypothetical protein CHL78_016610 [Romboutsia weinsteinii]